MISDPEIAERLATLDARDRLLRQQMTKQTELSQAQAYIGTCQEMCPERERCLRVGSSISIFERDEHNLPNESSMIKEYRRAGADQEEPLPHDLRTPDALERTMNHLCYNIMDDPRSKTQELVLAWYDFLWDRLRAIRKDITQQNICDQASAILVERCTRFHIHSCYAMNCVKDFDVDMNKRNLNDCLQMLRQMYTDLRNIGIRCDGEFEFQKYDILLHLEEDQLSSNVAMKTSEHRSSSDMKYVTQVFYAYTNNHYYKFFKLMEKADYMTSCILSLYVKRVRLNAMKIIIASCTSKQPILYPADSIVDTLGFDDLADLSTFASCLSIEMQEKGGKYFLILSKDLINTVRQAGSNVQPLKSIRLVESKKMNSSVGQLVHCQPVGQPRFVTENHPKTQVFRQEIFNLPVSQSPNISQQPVQTPSILTNPLHHHRESIDQQDYHDQHQRQPQQQQPAIMHLGTEHISFQNNLASIVPEYATFGSGTIEKTPSSSSFKSSEKADVGTSNATPTLDLIPHPIDQQIDHNQRELEQSPQMSSCSPSPEPSELPYLAIAAEAPVCRLRFRKPPRFHPFELVQERKEKPKQKRKSFNDSIQSLRDEIVDEKKANDNLMKIVSMIS